MIDLISDITDWFISIVWDW